MGKNRSARVFSFFHFEETGDSEMVLGGDDPGKHVIPVVDDEDGNSNDKKDIDQDDDDDDVGSCCYDSSYSGSNNSRQDDDEFDERDCDAESEDAATHEINVKKQQVIPFRHETWESEHYSDTASTTDLSGYFKKPSSSSCIISVDTAKEPLTEAEKNRRFWEACLAS